MKKIQLITITTILFCTLLNAQNRHEISLYGGGGLSTLNYKVSAGEQQPDFGGKAGLGWHVFFNPHWGLGTGAELAFYNAKYSLNSLTTRSMATDGAETFEFRNAIDNYSETQNAMMLQIPLMLQFQTGKTHQFFATAGAKVGFPLSATYESSTETIRNSGYYSYEDYEYTTQDFRGFGTFTGKEASGDIDFKTAVFASAEIGMKWKLAERLYLYTGVYLDYGLNNIYKEANPAQPFVEYNNDSPRDFAVNSIMKSEYTQNDVSQSFTSKVTPVAAGLTLRLSFGLGNAEKTVKTEDKALTPTEPVELVPSPEEAERKAKEAARLAEEEAARKAAENQRLAQEAAELQRIKAIEAENLRNAKANIQEPIDGYAFKQVELSAEQKKKLDEKIVLLKQYPDLKVFIYGHTCNIGTVAANEKTGLARAENVKKYLISNGIPENCITGIASKRDTEPLLPNTNKENRLRNRRVVIEIID